MFSKLFLATTLLVSFLKPITATRNVWSLSEEGIGATIILKDGAAETTGFSANFYDYPWGDFIPFWNDDFVAESYTTRSIRTSATAVTSPNFSFDDGTDNLYGLYNINMANVLIELKGYFVRKYNHLSNIFIYVC